MLGAAAFVAHRKHGDTLADEEHHDGVFLLAQTQGVDGGLAGHSLDPAIPTGVVIRAVVVVLAVAEIMLLGVRNEIAQGEAIVGGDEID